MRRCNLDACIEGFSSIEEIRKNERERKKGNSKNEMLEVQSVGFGAWRLGIMIRGDGDKVIRDCDI